MKKNLEIDYDEHLLIREAIADLSIKYSQRASKFRRDGDHATAQMNDNRAQKLMGLNLMLMKLFTP